LVSNNHLEVIIFNMKSNKFSGIKVRIDIEFLINQILLWLTDFGILDGIWVGVVASGARAATSWVWGRNLQHLSSFLVIAVYVGIVFFGFIKK